MGLAQAPGRAALPLQQPALTPRSRRDTAFIITGVTPKLSICILNLNAAAYLPECLDSLSAALDGLDAEVIVADNGSVDGSQALLRDRWPAVRLIENGANIGYSAGMNRALAAAGGEYVVQLNPDTRSHPRAFRILAEFMDANPRAGICSPRVLNRDGSFQRQCRRSFARPWDVISYFSGLSRLFPRSPLFGRYLQTWRDELEQGRTEAVSGSCMVIRSRLLQDIGLLDEAFFAYQEDTDFCYRANAAGWETWYIPSATVTHYGGQGGSRTQPWRAIYQWHRSYLLYYRKHLARQYFFLINWLMYAGFALKLVLALTGNLLNRSNIVGTPKP